MPSSLFSSFKELFKSLLAFSHTNKQPNLAQRPSKYSSKSAKARFNDKLPWKRQSAAPPVHHFSPHYAHIHNSTCASSRTETAGSATGLSQHHRPHEQQQYPFINQASDAETTHLDTHQGSQFELESDSSSEHLGLRTQRSFYRLHYGPHIDNIENGPHHDSIKILLPHSAAPNGVESFGMQELDHEVAETLSLGIHKRRRRSFAPSNHSYDNGATSSPSSPRLPLNRSFSRKVAPTPRSGGHRDKGKQSYTHGEGREIKSDSMTKERYSVTSSVKTRRGQLEACKPAMTSQHQERTMAVAHLRQRQKQIAAQNGESHFGMQREPSEKPSCTATYARINRGVYDRERHDIRSPNESAFTPQLTTFCDWSLGLRDCSKQSPTTYGEDIFSLPAEYIHEHESQDGSVFAQPSSVASRRHLILTKAERAERLLAHIKERVDDRSRLENALCDTDALLMRYEAEIARDWEAKFVDLCQNVRELQLGVQIP
ncbi:unnamed protein product [Mortierella alpina]